MQKTIFIILLLISNSIIAQTIDSISIKPNLSTTASFGYHGIHHTGHYFHLNTRFKNKYAFELGYGRDFLNSYTLSGKYYFNNGINQFYTSLGYGHFYLKEKEDSEFQIRSAHFSFGHQFNYKKHLVIGAELVYIKYINQTFKSNQVTYKVNYLINEKIYFEVGVYIGYRFNWFN